VTSFVESIPRVSSLNLDIAAEHPNHFQTRSNQKWSRCHAVC